MIEGDVEFVPRHVLRDAAVDQVRRSHTTSLADDDTASGNDYLRGGKRQRTEEFDRNIVGVARRHGPTVRGLLDGTADIPEIGDLLCPITYLVGRFTREADVIEAHTPLAERVGLRDIVEFGDADDELVGPTHPNASPSGHGALHDVGFAQKLLVPPRRLVDVGDGQGQVMDT